MACASCKRKKSKIRGLGFNQSGLMTAAKTGAIATGGYVLGQYVTKMIAKDETDAEKVKSNRGLGGFGKIAVAALLPSLYQNELTDSLATGLFVSGMQDVIAVNMAETAEKIGIAGIVETPQQYYPQYFEANTQREPSMTI